MKSSVSFPPEYFLKYKEKPVRIKPFSKIQERVGELYLKKVKNILKSFEIKVTLRGSTAFKISGKGDIEIGVFPKAGDWGRVIETLAKKFGETENLEKNYARFNILHKTWEVEIVVLKGREALTDQKLHEYLLGHPGLIKRYEEVKKKYSFSKREYNFRKNEFLRHIEKQIPEY